MTIKKSSPKNLPSEEELKEQFRQELRQSKAYIPEDTYEEFTGNSEPEPPPRQVRSDVSAQRTAQRDNARDGTRRPVGRPKNKPTQLSDDLHEVEESSVVEELRTKKVLSPEDLLDIAENVIVPFAELLTGCKLFSYQREFAVGVAVATIEGKAKTVTALFARQCIGGDEYIIDQYGHRCKIKDHPNSWWTGVKETYTIKTSSGYTIQDITDNHQLCTRNGWKELRDIEVGEDIAVLSSKTQVSDRPIFQQHEIVGVSSGEAIIFDTLIHKNLSGREVDVYDIEIPEKQWFDCGGIVCHNSGKSQTVAVIVAGLGILLPTLANVFEADQFERFRNGFFVGVYGPDYDKASIVYGRIKDMLSSQSAAKVLQDPDLGVDPKEASRLKFSNGFRVDLRTANKDAKIEGFTYHLIILDEAQDMSAMVIEKSIRPMRNFHAGAMVYIGTPSPERTVFQDTCLRNGATDRANGTEKSVHRLHYEFDYHYVLAANKNYAIAIDEDREIMGEHSDAFRMAYKLEWLDGKGKFITQAEFNQVAVRATKIIKDVVLRRGRKEESEFVLSDQFLPYDKSSECLFSIDYGGKNDSTILTIAKVWNDCPVMIGDEARYNIHVLDFLELLGDNHEDQFPQILAKLREYNIIAGINDATGLGDPIHQRLSAVLRNKQVQVHPFIYTSQSKHEGFALLKQEWSAGRITVPGSQSTIMTQKYKKFQRQMCELIRDYNEKTKRNTYRAPDVKDAHDDYPCSLMMLVWLANRLTLPRLAFTDTTEYQRTSRAVEAQRRYLKYLDSRNVGGNNHLAAPNARPRMFGGRSSDGKSFEELLEEEKRYIE